MHLLLTIFLIILASGICSNFTYAISLDDINGTGAQTGNIQKAGNKIITYILFCFISLNSF